MSHKESIENGVSMYNSVAGKEVRHGIMQKDYDVFQVCDFWKPLVPEEVPILDLENPTHIWVPTVTSDDNNEPIKANVKCSQDFDRPKFHKLMGLTYLNEKKVENGELSSCLSPSLHK